MTFFTRRFNVCLFRFFPLSPFLFSHSRLLEKANGSETWEMGFHYRWEVRSIGREAPPRAVRELFAFPSPFFFFGNSLNSPLEVIASFTLAFLRDLHALLVCSRPFICVYDDHSISLICRRGSARVSKVSRYIHWLLALGVCTHSLYLPANIHAILNRRGENILL